MSSNKRICLEQFSGLSIDATKTSKDSFNRFGNDLTGLILSYLEVEDQYRLLTVNKMFAYNMFVFSTNVCITKPFQAFASMPLYASMSVLIKRQFDAVRQLTVNLDNNGLDFAIAFYNNCPNITTLKLEGDRGNSGQVSYAVDFMHRLKVKPSLKQLYLNILFKFHRFRLDYFLGLYGPVLCEFGYDYENNYMVESFLYRMPKLKKLHIFCKNPYQIFDQEDLQRLSMLCAKKQLKGLYFYRNSAEQIDYLLDLVGIKKLFPDLDYYYAGPDHGSKNSGGLFKNYDFRKSSMRDMLKFQTFVRDPECVSYYNVLYYSRNHSFLYLNQIIHFSSQVKQIFATIPDDVKSLVFRLSDLHVHHDIERRPRMVMQILNKYRNITHIRLAPIVFNFLFIKHVIDLIEANPSVTYCLAEDNTEPLKKCCNVWTNSDYLFRELEKYDFSREIYY